MNTSNAPTRCPLARFVVLAAATLSMLAIQTARAASKPKVVATISIIGDWAHQVGGEDIELTTLVGPDGDPHEYEAVPADSMKLGHADVILENGLGLETWLDKLCESAQTIAARVVLTSGVEARHIPHFQNEAHTERQDDRDPHAWQNVKDAVIMVNNIRDALAKVDPDHAGDYKTRAAAYDKQLQTLDSDIASAIASIPANHRKLVTSHDAFGYFAQRYGIDIPRNALESITTEASDPSAKQIADVIDQIKSAGVPVIFLENIQNPRLTEQIANEANVKIGPPLYSDALGQPGTAGDTYLKMMRYNVEAIVRSLRS